MRKFIYDIIDEFNKHLEYMKEKESIYVNAGWARSFITQKLVEQERIHRAEIDVWHTAFGSTQLTHAIDNVKVNLEQQRKTLVLDEEDLEYIINDWFMKNGREPKRIYVELAKAIIKHQESKGER